MGLAGQGLRGGEGCVRCWGRVGVGEVGEEGEFFRIPAAPAASPVRRVLAVLPSTRVALVQALAAAFTPAALCGFWVGAPRRGVAAAIGALRLPPGGRRLVVVHAV